MRIILLFTCIDWDSEGIVRPRKNRHANRHIQKPSTRKGRNLFLLTLSADNLALKAPRNNGRYFRDRDPVSFLRGHGSVHFLHVPGQLARAEGGCGVKRGILWGGEDYCFVPKEQWLIESTMEVADKRAFLFVLKCLRVMQVDRVFHQINLWRRSINLYGAPVDFMPVQVLFGLGFLFPVP